MDAKQELMDDAIDGMGEAEDEEERSVYQERTQDVYAYLCIDITVSMYVFMYVCMYVCL